ncbi:MAG: peptidoglycan DD-metalloendopeptidase family protein, partial [bacterium]
MSRLLWIAGGSAAAYYLWSRSQDRDHAGAKQSAPSSSAPPVTTEPATSRITQQMIRDEMTGRWVWPVPRWNGRAPVISDGLGTPRPGGILHGGVDIMFTRLASDPYKSGTPNGSPHHVMPDGLVALAASDGRVWSAGPTPRGLAIRIDHSPRKVTTFYTHLEKLLVTPCKPGASQERVVAGQPIGLIGFDPLDAAHLKHLLCAAAHKRCNAQRPLCRAVGTRPRFCSGCRHRCPSVPVPPTSPVTRDPPGGGGAVL